MLTSMLTSKTTPITLTLERFPGGEMLTSMLTSDFSYFSKFANNNNSVYKNMINHLHFISLKYIFNL